MSPLGDRAKITGGDMTVIAPQRSAGKVQVRRLVFDFGRNRSLTDQRTQIMTNSILRTGPTATLIAALLAGTAMAGGT